VSLRPLWYRDSVIYQIDPSLYRDSNGDGVGDFAGMRERLQHVRGLGATCVWLMPFYASPFLDGGYDVTDHLAVDPRFGDLAEFVLFMEEADDLGINVLIELVAQHTSDQHRWFQEARHDRKSPYRDYYIWADEPQETDVEPIFPTVEDSVWTWDDEAQQFYRHVFYAHEPDLALDNPLVRQEMHRTMTFWLRLGIAGFRVDAAPFLVERGRAAEPDSDGQWLVREMRELVAHHQPGAVLLGEVDVEPQKYADYFGDGDGMTMLLNFWINNHLFLALARGRAEPLVRALRDQPVPPRHAQYAHWLRNHDELDLEQLTEEERAEVLQAFAPDESMQAYGRGIRRRLAPMLEGDVRRQALAHAVLLSLPGTPVLRYGEEIGMGDDLSRPEREAVRTPMQWANASAAGFSAGNPDHLAAPVISGGQFGYQDVNVYAQALQDDSLMKKITAMVNARIGLREVGRNPVEVLDVDNEAVLALRYAGDNGSHVVMLANLGEEKQEIRLPDQESRMVDVLADDDYGSAEHPPGPTRRTGVSLNGFGYRWLRPRETFFQ